MPEYQNVNTKKKCESNHKYTMVTDAQVLQLDYGRTNPFAAPSLLKAPLHFLLAWQKNKSSK